MLENITEIINALNQVTLSFVENEIITTDCLIISTGQSLVDSNGGTYKQDIILLRQRTAQQIGIQRLCEKIADELNFNGHSYCSRMSPERVQIAGIILAMALMTASLRRNTILQEVNFYITLIQAASVKLRCVLAPPEVGVKTDCFGQFIYGKLDLDKLRDECHKVGCDYVKRHEKKILNKRSIIRESVDIKIINHKLDLSKFVISNLEASRLYNLAEEYFSVLARCEQKLFLIELDKQQSVYCAAGIGAISSNSLLHMESFNQWISVFTFSNNRDGWVSPIQTYPLITTVEPAAYAAGRNEVINGLQLKDWNKLPLDNYLQQFSEYIMVAQGFAGEMRLEEAFLHYIFGLDVLLGGEAGESLTEILAGRVAVICHKILGKPQDEIFKSIKFYYSLRSGYAHRGEKGRLETALPRDKRFADLLVDLEKICKIIFAAGCAARLKPWSSQVNEKEARSNWISRIDIILTKQDAAMPISREEISDIGIDEICLVNDKFYYLKTL